MNGLIPSKDDKVPQSEGEAEAFQSWRYGFVEGLISHQRSKQRKARPQLERSIQSHPLFKNRELLLGRCEQEIFASSLECRAPQKVPLVTERILSSNKFQGVEHLVYSSTDKQDFIVFMHLFYFQYFLFFREVLSLDRKSVV